jgi:hypothetical protein
MLLLDTPRDIGTRSNLSFVITPSLFSVHSVNHIDPLLSNMNLRGFEELTHNGFCDGI